MNEVLKCYSIAYLSGEVRTGKTLTSLKAVELYGSFNVLFLTRKGAISSIIKDYNSFNFKYKLTVINYEQLHNVKNDFDFVIYDEAHTLGAYPKPSLRTKIARKLFYNTPCILMSGTPAVESYSQLYHQFAVSGFSPFKNYANFYKWANVFVTKKELRLPTHTVTDYSNANVNQIKKIIEPLVVRITQDEADFKSKVNETILEVKTPERLQYLANKLIKNKVLEGEKGFIFGDTPAKLQGKVHQLVNGHCIIEDNNGGNFTKIFDTYKIDFIAEKFKGKKIAIMYYYQAEFEMLKNKLYLATSLDEFNNTDKSIAIQQSSTEGLNLSSADAIVFLNLGFSGKNYLQARDRLTVKDRLKNNVYFICESYGITKKILETVQSKKDFNSKMFTQWHQSNRQN